MRTNPALNGPTSGWAYDADGNETAGNSTDSTGLVKFGARFYDPSVGRFTQQDPTGQESNAYAYVACNPINATDATGQSSKCAVEAISGIVVAVGLSLGVAAEIAFGPETGGASLIALALEGEAVAIEYGMAAYLIVKGFACD